MVPFSNLLTALQDVADPRRAQGKRYPLPHLLMIRTSRPAGSFLINTPSKIRAEVVG